MERWIEQLEPIIKEYQDGGELLDGDKVDTLCRIIKAKINFHQGNCTEEECEYVIDNATISSKVEDASFWLFTAYKSEDKYGEDAPYFKKVFTKFNKMEAFSASHSVEGKKKDPDYCSTYQKFNNSF